MDTRWMRWGSSGGPPERENPHYLGGFIIAGSIRIGVIQIFDPTFFRDPDQMAEINGLCNQLDAMISQVKESVNAAHVVKTDYNTIKQLGWFAHFHMGKQFEIFRYGEKFRPPIYEEEAAERAGQARDRGVEAELSFLHIPVAEQTSCR